MTTPTTVQVKLQLRADTAANWTSINPVLLANELGRETDTGKIKIGNGSTAWNSLAYQAWATLPIAVNVGGTGQTTYTNGQLLIGNTTGNTLTKATLTAGAGVAITNGNGSITVATSGISDAQIAAGAEIAVSKLADGAARQLLQTDAAGTGVEWASNIDIPGTLDVTSAATFDSSVAVTGALTKSGNNVVTVGDTGTVTSAMIANGTIVDADINATAEIAVSKLADGAARQLLQTDAAGTGVEWANDIDVPGTLDVTGAATFDNNVIIQGDLTVNGTETIINTQTLEVEDKNIIVGKVTTPTDITADGGGITLKGTTDKTINWIDATDAWTLSEHVSIASAKEYRIAGIKVLDATSLGSGVTGSSLTSVGTIGTGVWQGTAINKTYLDNTLVSTADTGTVTSTMIADGTIVNGDISASAAIVDTKLATISTAGKVSNSATTATDANTASAIVARDASGNFSAGTITANLSGNASTVTTNANLTGDVTSVGNATSIAAGVIVNADVNASAAIAGTKISPDFGSQTITTTGVVSAALGAAATPSLTFTGDLNTGIYSPGADQVAISTNGTGRLFVDASGSVGVGGTPNTRFEVTTGAGTEARITSTVDNNADLTFYTNNVQRGIVEGNSLGMLLGTTGALPTTFITSNTERLRITSAGLVGIGTSSPGQTLDVNGVARISTEIRLKNSAGNVSYCTFEENATTSSNTWISGDGRATGNIGFWTNNNERVRITSAGNVGIGTTPTSIFHVKAATNRNFKIDSAGGGGGDLRISALNDADSANVNLQLQGDQLFFAAGGAERARIDSSGRWLLGTSSARSFFSGLDIPAFQVEGTSTQGREISVTSSTSNVDGAVILLGKQRSGTLGGNTIVQNGDQIGYLGYQASDGTKMLPAAFIAAEVDGTPGANDMPGRLVFSTTADGASSPTERMRISSTGQISSSTSSSAGITGAGAACFVNNTSTATSGVLGFCSGLGAAGSANNTNCAHFTGITQGVSYYYLYGNGTSSFTSDSRKKKNIETTRDGYLEDLSRLRVVKYNWINQTDGDPKELGLIAQEVEKVFPGLVQDGGQLEGDDFSCKVLKGSVLPFMLLKALQEAAEKIETLEARLTALETA